MMNFNTCEFCEKAISSTVTSADLNRIIDVCDDHFKAVFLKAVEQGEHHFYEWAEMTFGGERAEALTLEIFGEDEGLDYLAKEDEELVKLRESGETMLLFTYGILKYPYNLKREGATNIIENCTVKGHHMHLYASSFPITRMTHDGSGVIYGTLFEIPKYVVRSSYDQTESYEPNRHPSQNMYNRIEIEVETPDGMIKQAEMYYANQRQFAKDLIPYTRIASGNFDDRHTAASFKRKQYGSAIRSKK